MAYVQGRPVSLGDGSLVVSTTQLNTMRVNSVALCKTTYITWTCSVFVLLTFGGASTLFLALECSMMVGADMIRLTFSQSRRPDTSDVYKSGMTESNLFWGNHICWIYQSQSPLNKPPTPKVQNNTTAFDNL